MVCLDSRDADPIVREAERREKAYALNHSLKHAMGEFLVIADVDAVWPSNALKEVLKWFAEPAVGAVSCLKRPVRTIGVKESYRRYYNVVRVAESKAYATPIFHGGAGSIQESSAGKGWRLSHRRRCGRQSDGRKNSLGGF